MPILLIEMVGELSAPREDFAKELANACSPAFPPEHGEVWVQLRFVPRQNWAISGRESTETSPVFVHVLREVNPKGEALNQEVRGLTSAVARLTGRSLEDVHILYEPSAQGRMAFGGRLLE